LTGAAAGLAGLAIAVSALAYTGSWFTRTEAVVNQLSSDAPLFSVGVVDEFTPPAEVRPGSSTPKRVGAVNRGNQPAFVRLLVWPVVTDPNGVPLPARLGQEVKLGGLDAAKWRDGGDGYYYFLGRLAPGSATPDLFTAVELDGQLGAAYEGASLRLDVKTEAVEPRLGAYRMSWWGVSAPPLDPSLSVIDASLAALAWP
jgi:hypothetical protein